MKIKNVTRVIAREVNLEITGATLLTVEEARELPEKLRKRSYLWWWLRSPGKDSSHIAYVGFDGAINNYGADVDKYTGRVRPAIIISNLDAFNLQIGDTFVFGRAEFEIITNSKALCSTWIEISPFREDWKADDTNDYEKSDIKKIVDEWFEKSIKGESK